VARPVVLVVASPYVGATALARLLEQRDYDVVVPDIGVGEEPPPGVFDAVLTTLPVGDYGARVVIELPATWTMPVRVTVDGVTEELVTRASDPMEEVLELLDRHVRARLAAPPRRGARSSDGSGTAA
jgi:hypothetical protein